MSDAEITKPQEIYLFSTNTDLMTADMPEELKQYMIENPRLALVSNYLIRAALDSGLTEYDVAERLNGIIQTRKGTNWGYTVEEPFTEKRNRKSGKIDLVARLEPDAETLETIVESQYLIYKKFSLKIPHDSGVPEDEAYQKYISVALTNSEEIGSRIESHIRGLGKFTLRLGEPMASSPS